MKHAKSKPLPSGLAGSYVQERESDHVGCAAWAPLGGDVA